MNIQEEISSILDQVKNNLENHRGLGMDPPLVPRHEQKQMKPEVKETTPSESETAAYPDTLEGLAAYVENCTRCKLHQKRHHLVFGEGNPRARVAFVGEGPGREEDLVGRPFVGKAGKLLTRIIENGMGLQRKDVYICNIVKCRPPNNRDPEPDEIEKCVGFMKQQIKIIKPEVICALGRVAAQTMIGPDFKISRERGQWRSFMGIPLMAIYHPAYLLRNTSAKRDVWEDVKKIMKRLGLEVRHNG